MLDLACKICGKTVPHTVTVENRWATPKAHINKGTVCCVTRRLPKKQLDALLDELEPEPIPCPDCGEVPCHPQCLSGGGL
jgi:hypothetical protein